MPPEKLFLKKLDGVSHGVEAFLHTWASQGRRALCGVALTCWCRNRVGGRRGSPASLYPHPVRSAHAHATLILETCKSGCRLGRRLIAVTEFPTVIIPVPGSQPSLYPARWLPRLRRRAGVAPLVQGRGGGRGRCASWCHPSRCAPVASGFQLRQPSPGFCGLSLFKSMNHGGAHGKSFYRNEHIVSIPAELFWGQQMEKMRCAGPSCLGQALLLGDEGSGSNS